MCGCGKSRSLAPSAGSRPSSPGGPAAAAPRPADAADVVLRYLGRTPLLVKGPVSGRVYALRPDAPLTEADARDVSPFLSSGLFAR